MKKVLVFDFDGTLVDSRLDLLNTVNQMRKYYGLAPLPLEQVLSYVGDGVKMLLSRSLSDSKIDPETAMNVMQQAYRANLNLASTLYPGVYKTIRDLQQNGWKIALFSNKEQDFCKSALYEFGIGTCFDVILGRTDDFPLKPDPEGLLFIQELLGIEDVAGSWMIGDSAQDILAGRAAGMKTCFCNFGFGDRKGEEPTAYIDKFEDLKQILV